MLRYIDRENIYSTAIYYQKPFKQTTVENVFRHLVNKKRISSPKSKKKGLGVRGWGIEQKEGLDRVKVKKYLKFFRLPQHGIRKQLIDIFFIFL